MNVCKGRWGFYPCSYETYRKLKTINKVILLTLRQKAAWFRWARKQPQNRKSWQFIPGQNVASWTMAPEPKICPVFMEKVDVSAYMDLGGNWYKEKVKYHSYLPNKLGKLVGDLARSYKMSRTPLPEEIFVEPLLVKEDVIDSIYELCKDHV